MGRALWAHFWGLGWRFRQFRGPPDIGRAWVCCSLPSLLPTWLGRRLSPAVGSGRAAAEERGCGSLQTVHPRVPGSRRRQGLRGQKPEGQVRSQAAAVIPSLAVPGGTGCLEGAGPGPRAAPTICSRHLCWEVGLLGNRGSPALGPKSCPHWRQPWEAPGWGVASDASPCCLCRTRRLCWVNRLVESHRARPACDKCGDSQTPSTWARVSKEPEKHPHTKLSLENEACQRLGQHYTSLAGL